MIREDFGTNFKWGVSTAAYQIEGAHNIDGKGKSIWDEFANTKGKIFKNQNANASCNFYEHYSSDIALLYELNIPNFRFSLSWSRIMPTGRKVVNERGIDFYNRVIDFCLELGIEPWITLYHWDLPLDLEKKGGWTNRDIVDWFGDYTSVCIKAFGDRVKNWMVINEPMVFTGAGYFLGVHAPGKKGLTRFLSAVHHATLCQAEGGRVIRSLGSNFNIGTTFSCSHIEPLHSTEKDHQAAAKADALLNRMFVEPLIGLGYPVNDLKILQRMETYIKSGDEQKLSFDMDFIGIQNYTREIVTHSYFMPFLKAKIIKADKRKVERTLMNWEIYPESIYHILKKFNDYKNIPQIIVTENGAAFEDHITDGKVHDEKRIKYLQDHISQVLRAKKEGVNVNGYFVWTLIDNFEWAEGFYPRFGLIYVNFSTNQRIIKSSGYWYRQFLQNINSKPLVQKSSEYLI
ncbi:MAG: beta-glucosidase [Bacteroidota bacterium]|nr:beta-glucosidase [Bacteroidota bacterium]